MHDLSTPSLARMPESEPASPLTLSYQVAARVTNVALTAQVQIAYACAIAASENAERAAVCIEQAWPDTPLRKLVVQAYRDRAHERQGAAHEVLARARRWCGLAYARLHP
jgi:hypothetical protein